MESPNPQQDYVLRTIESRDVHFVRCWFCDVLGNMKSFAVVPDELERAFTEGIGFDGSCIEGFATHSETDMLAFPDPSTFQVLPWRPDTNAVARMFCHIRNPEGEPFESDPRHILEQVVQKATAMGFVLNVGPELEFFYFKDPHSTEVLDRGSYFDLTSLDYASDLRRDTVLTLEKMGIPVEYSHHEIAPSQHEIDLRYSDALSMADAVMTYKLVVKEIALKHGVYASFMPKPIADVPGSSMHMHMSLFDEEGNNAFFDPTDPSRFNLSKTAKMFIAGILRYAREYCLVTNQYVNSYKRFTGADRAPIRIAWAHNDKTTLVRIPGYRPNNPDACRIELRNPDPAANPYLAFAVVFAAGLKGIEDKLELEPPFEGPTPRRTSRYELLELGDTILPESLGEAITEFEKSHLMKEVLGERTHAYLVETKRADWESYQRIVTSWELERGLAVL